MAWTVTTLRESSATNSNDSRARSRFYEALSDNDTDDEHSASTATGLPDFGDAHPTDTNAFVADIRVQRNPQKRRLFEIEVVYSTRVGNFYDQDDPLSQPVEIEYNSFYETELATGYFDESAGRYIAFTTSAGEPFEPQEVNARRASLSIVKNVATFNSNLADSYVGATNTDTFYGKPINSGIVHAIKGVFVARPAPLNGYWTVSGEFHFKPLIPKIYTTPIVFITNVCPWDKIIADAGFYYLGAANERYPIVDGNGEKTTVAMPLDGAGGSLSTWSASAPQVFRYYPNTPRREYAGLGI